MLNDLEKPIVKEIELIKIGMPEFIASYIVTDISESINKNISIEQLESGEGERRILNGELDFSFSVAPKPNSGIEYLKIGEFEFNSFGDKNLYRAYRDEIPFVEPTTTLPNNIMGYKNRDAWPEEVNRNIKFYVNSMSIALSLFRGGKAAIYLPNFIHKIEKSKSNKGLIRLKGKLNIPQKRSIYLVKKKNMIETIEMKKVCKVIRKVVL